jgi:peptidoglycan/LPS O-acetylase OafA/YrhL
MLLIYSGITWQERLIFTLMSLLFLAFIYYPDKLSFLENKFIAKIGLCSYVLYLAHEHIAVLVIHSWGAYFYPLSFVLPILMVCIMIALSILYTDHIDKHITNYLKKLFLSKHANRSEKQFTPSTSGS